MRFVTTAPLNAVASGSAATSAAIDASNLLSVSATVVVATAGTAAVKVQVSNDPANPTNWVDLPSATVTPAGAGTYLIPKVDTCYRWLRIVQAAGGSAGGTVTVYLEGLGF